MKVRSASLLLAVAVVLAPSPAHADVRTHTDPTGDVQYLVNTDPSNVPPPVAAPARTHGDITVVRVNHGTKTVRVATYFRSLPRAGQFQGHVFRFVVGTFERRAQISAGPDVEGGWKGQSELSTPSGKVVACRGLTHQVEYAKRRVVLTVPHACLRNPKAVKVGVGTVVLAGERTYFDDGFKAGGTMGMQALRPTLGPAVAR